MFAQFYNENWHGSWGKLSPTFSKIPWGGQEGSTHVTKSTFYTHTE